MNLSSLCLKQIVAYTIKIQFSIMSDTLKKLILLDSRYGKRTPKYNVGEANVRKYRGVSYKFCGISPL